MTDQPHQDQFKQIFDAEHKKVFNICLNMVQNAQDAEDLTQEVFIEIHQSLRNFAGRSGISTWIYRIAVNKCLDFLKARKTKKRLALLTRLFNPQTGALLHPLPHFDHPGVLLENKERTQLLFAALNALPPNQKTAFVLSKIENFSYKEIAEIMMISEKAVESLNQRAKEGLKKLS